MDNGILPLLSPRHPQAGRIRVLVSDGSNLIIRFQLWSYRPGLPSVAGSLLFLNVGRRMVMSNTPFTAALDDQHSEARWTRHRHAILHAGKLVKSGDHYSVVTEHDGVPLLDGVLVEATL